MRYFFALIALLFLVGCSGTHSTLREGFAYQFTQDEVHTLLDSTLRAHVASDRMLPGSKLVVSGYDRSLIDTQTYTLSAIPVPALRAFGLEVAHEGTMFNGPTKASRIYDDLKRRADLLGPRVPIGQQYSETPLKDKSIIYRFTDGKDISLLVAYRHSPIGDGKALTVAGVEYCRQSNSC